MMRSDNHFADVVDILVMCLVMVWLAGYYFDSEKDGFMLRGMKAGIVVGMMMTGIVYFFKEVIVDGYTKRALDKQRRNA